MSKRGKKNTEELLDMKIVKRMLREERIKRIRTRYQRWDILIMLSAILLVQILVIIRFCDYPLWGILENALGRFLLVPKGSDRTLYNIAISYVAAYIFYLLQVHIPMYITHRNNLDVYRKAIGQEIAVLEELAYVVVSKCKVGDKYYRLQMISDDLIAPRCLVYGTDTLQELIARFTELHEKHENELSGVEMDVTLKEMFRNIACAEAGNPYCSLLPATCSPEERESYARYMTTQYLRKRGRLRFYGLVPDYIYVDEATYDDTATCMEKCRNRFLEAQQYNKRYY